MPSPIAALAFPPLPLPSAKGKGKETNASVLKFGTLVVGRANGNIELCEWTGAEGQIEAHQAWVIRRVCFNTFSCLSYLESERRHYAALFPRK